VAFHVGDIGATVLLEVKETRAALNISAATSLQIEIQRPDGTTLDKTAVFNSDGTDGKIKYVTVSGDLNTAGRYEVQGYFVLSTWTGRTERVAFQVFGNAV
jgi:hypothetical protein